MTVAIPLIVVPIAVGLVLFAVGAQGRLEAYSRLRRHRLAVGLALDLVSKNPRSKCSVISLYAVLAWLAGLKYIRATPLPPGMPIIFAKPTMTIYNT